MSLSPLFRRPIDVELFSCIGMFEDCCMLIRSALPLVCFESYKVEKVPTRSAVYTSHKVEISYFFHTTLVQKLLYMYMSCEYYDLPRITVQASVMCNNICPAIAFCCLGALFPLEKLPFNLAILATALKLGFCNHKIKLTGNRKTCQASLAF